MKRPYFKPKCRRLAFIGWDFSPVSRAKLDARGRARHRRILRAPWATKEQKREARFTLNVIYGLGIRRRQKKREFQEVMGMRQRERIGGKDGGDRG